MAVAAAMAAPNCSWWERHGGMAAWLEGYRRSWEGHLDALEAHLEQTGDDE